MCYIELRLPQQSVSLPPSCRGGNSSSEDTSDLPKGMQPGTSSVGSRPKSDQPPKPFHPSLDSLKYSTYIFSVGSTLTSYLRAGLLSQVVENLHAFLVQRGFLLHRASNFICKCREMIFHTPVPGASTQLLFPSYFFPFSKLRVLTVSKTRTQRR